MTQLKTSQWFGAAYGAWEIAPQFLSSCPHTLCPAGPF